MEEDSSIGSNLYEEDDGELFIFDDLYYCDEESFEFSDVLINKYDDNPYIQNLIKTATLNILNPSRVKKAFIDNGPLGLFNLFFSNPLLESIRVWTEKRLYKKYNRKLEHDEVKLSPYHELQQLLLSRPKKLTYTDIGDVKFESYINDLSTHTKSLVSINVNQEIQKIVGNR